MAPQYMQNYLMYLNVNIEYDTISCLHNIDLKTFSLLSPIYTEIIIHMSKNDIIKSIEEFKNAQIILYNSDVKNKNAIGPNSQNAINNYTKELTLISNNLTNNEHNNLFRDLSNIFINKN